MDLTLPEALALRVLVPYRYQYEGEPHGTARRSGGHVGSNRLGRCVLRLL
jgi:hypothetical protein